METGLHVYGGDSRVGALTQKVSHLTSLKVKGVSCRTRLEASPLCVTALELDPWSGPTPANIVVTALSPFSISWM